MAHLSKFTVLDYSEEKSGISIYNGAITAASLPGFLTDFGAFKAAIAGMSLGTLAKEAWIGDETILSQVAPTDPDAQRERKALVVYQGDTSGKKFTFTVPAARVKDGSDVSLLLPGTDKYDLTATEVAALVTAFETIGRTPDSDTETVTVLEIRLVGRNI